MSNEWKEVELGDCCDILSSKRIFAKDYVEEGIPFYRSKEIIEKALGQFSGDELYITEDRFNEVKEKFGAPIKGDLLISEVGNRSGIPYCVKEDYDFYFKDGNLIWFRDFGQNLDSSFLEFFLSSRVGQSQIDAMMIGSAQKALTIADVKKIKIKVPPLEEQKAIAYILGKLDDKIELNRQMNQTLEQMAQALFQSWFVDFDPVLDNALVQGNPIPEALHTKAEKRKKVLSNHPAFQAPLENINHPAFQAPLLEKEGNRLGTRNLNSPPFQRGVPEGGGGLNTKPVPEGGSGSLLHTNPELAAQFPSTFTYNETLGKYIPEGWEVNELGDITTELRRGISPKYLEEGGVLVLNQKCIRNHEVDFSLGRRNDPTKKKVEGRLLQVGDMVVNSTGTGTLGRVANIKSLPEPTTIDSHVTVLRPDTEKVCVNYFSGVIFSIEKFIEAMGEGSTGQTELSRARLSEVNVLLAPKPIQEFIDAQLASAYEKQDANQKQMATLEHLREVLLPQLISGKVKVPKLCYTRRL